MIGEKKITEAVDAYIGYPKELGEGVDVSMRRDAFKAGVEWFKEALWHDAKEEPDKNKRILVNWLYKGKICSDIIRTVCDWQHTVMVYNVTKWCYIDDLLPKGGEK